LSSISTTDTGALSADACAQTPPVAARETGMHKSLILAVVATLPLAAVAAEPLAAGEAAALVCSGKLRSETLVREALARARSAFELNAFITLDEAGALAAAQAQDQRGGRACGLLTGVPIVVKDNTHVAGLPSTAGTPALKAFVPTADATVVARLRAAGAIVLGKTHMHELAFGISGWNPAFQSGPAPGVRNAYDRARSAGGSSSGTAAAIGARVVVAGLGTDTGGSVRLPCAFNGCAGLRPTVGRYPADGIAPISHTRDTAGPMGLSVSDVELLDRVIAGGPRARPAALKGLRLGLVAQTTGGLDPDTQAVFDGALKRLRAAGVVLVEVDAPKLPELNNAISFPIALYEAEGDMTAYLARYNTGVTIQQLAAQAVSPDVKGTYEALVIPHKLPGPDNTLVDAKPVYEAAMQTARPALKALYAGLFKTHRLDALLFPTVPHVAMPAGADASSVPVFVGAIRNTDPGSNAGLPGLQVPAGIGPTTGLPVGVELDGPAGSDRRLLAIGLALEKVLGRLPPPAPR
jgi:mandelamide amidase